jgi:hypothetical protein
MLRNFAAALVATVLVAGPAFAAQPSADAGVTPASAPAAVKTQAAVKPTDATKPVTPVKHASAHLRHHAVHAAKPGMTKTVKSPA